MNVIHYEDIPSTSQIALELGREGARHGTVVIAKQQTGGKGRMGRSFASPLGGLYFSLILRPEVELDRLSLLTIAVGVICAQLLEKVSGQGLMLKWPNDLYLQGRKLGGILCESTPRVNGQVSFLVVGIGLNINTRQDEFSPELQDKVISLHAVSKRLFDMELMMRCIVTELDQYVHKPEAKVGAYLNSWRGRDFLAGRSISWKAGDATRIYGTGGGLLDDGRYKLIKNNGTMIPVIGGELGFSPDEK